MSGLEKIDTISQLLTDIGWIVTAMTDDNKEDKDYNNLDEVITYLETVKCVLPQKTVEYYLERML